MVTVKRDVLGSNKGEVRSYKVADDTTILINKVLTLSDPNTAAEVSDTTDGLGYICAGFVFAEKEANDGATTISAFTQGDFVVTASGAIAVGQPVKSVGTGYMGLASGADMTSGAICGHALETAADDETFLMRLSV